LSDLTSSNDPQLGDLLEEGATLEAVKREDSLKSAKTLMMAKDYSQLPVMSGPRSLKGYIDWKSIADAYTYGRSKEPVGSSMETDPPLMRANKPLVKAIKLIGRRGFVLVQGHDDTVQGIVTSYDLAVWLRSIVEPILLIGGIETKIRQLIISGLGAEPIVSNLDIEVEPGTDLNDVLILGACVRVLQSESTWSQISKGDLDRRVFVRHMESVNLIRNRLLHFRDDKLSGEELGILRNMGTMMAKVEASSKNATTRE